MTAKFEAFQALSRDISRVHLSEFSGSPAKRKAWSLQAKTAVTPRLVDFTFAQVVPTGPSAGAIQFKDPDVSAMHELQWPFVACMSGTLVASDTSEGDDSGMAELLVWLRQVLWSDANAFDFPPDQRASSEGYRREFLHEQIFDITRTRRPSPIATFTSTEQGELVGPGCVTLPDIRQCNNELVWGRILSVSSPTSFSVDKDRIDNALRSEHLLANSFSELKDARRHLDGGEIKAAIRAAAPAVEAGVKHRAAVWDVGFPGGQLSFAEKIDRVLVNAGHPKYSSVDPGRSRSLLHLYRTRSSMHEGACYYRHSLSKDRVDVVTVGQVVPFLEAAESFLAWIDSLT